MSNLASILGLLAALGSGNGDGEEPAATKPAAAHHLALEPGMTLADVDRLNEVDLRLSGTTGPRTTTWIYGFTDAPDELYFLHFDRRGGSWVLQGWDVE